MSPLVDVQWIKERAQFELVLIRYGIVLTGSRVQRLITCPFHADGHPSCSIHLRRKLFHCFGCGAQGSILDFVARMEGASIPEAALIIADCCGIRLDACLQSASRRNLNEVAHRKPGAVGPKVANERNEPLRFRLTLEAEHPYLTARSVSQNEAGVFGLGYCRYGLMRSRICIPIHDERGALVAYAGRWAAEERPEGVNRYLLPRGFRKGSVVYNLHRVAGAEHVAIVEGYWSVFRLYRLGVPAIALMGFDVVTRYRINEIKAKVNGTWVHRYQIAYGTADNGIRSAINSITESGQDESQGVVSSPPTQFSYQQSAKNWPEEAGYTVPVQFTNDGDRGARFMEVNGDGLPDLVQGLVRGGSTFKYVWTNDGDGTGWTEDASYTVPIVFKTEDITEGVETFDANGDGLDDFVKSRNGTSEVWINDGDGAGWTHDTNYTVPVDFSDLSHPDNGVRVTDVNGDGLADLVQGHKDSAEYKRVWLNKGDGTGWALDSNYIVPEFFIYDGDRGVRFADINGDGLPDLIQSLSRSGTFKHAWINKGDGTGWSEDARYTIPAFFHASGSSHQGLRIFDINGDGLDDLVQAKSSIGRTVWINNGNGTGWTEDNNYSVPVDFFTSGDRGVRFADVDGDGLVDIVQSYYDSGGEVKGVVEQSGGES